MVACSQTFDEPIIQRFEVGHRTDAPIGGVISLFRINHLCSEQASEYVPKHVIFVQFQLSDRSRGALQDVYMAVSKTHLNQAGPKEQQYGENPE